MERIKSQKVERLPIKHVLKRSMQKMRKQQEAQNIGSVRIKKKKKTIQC